MPTSCGHHHSEAFLRFLLQENEESTQAAPQADAQETKGPEAEAATPEPLPETTDAATPEPAADTTNQ